MGQHRIKKSESEPLDIAQVKQVVHDKFLPENRVSYLLAPSKSLAISCQKINLDKQQMVGSLRSQKVDSSNSIEASSVSAASDPMI